jgi:hypothetical protein
MNRLSINFSVGLIAFLGLLACTPQAQQTGSGSSGGVLKKLVYDDYIYEDRIKTVLFYPNGASQTAILNPPVVNLQQYSPVVIEFDDLGKEYCNYYAKVYHCNADWSRSNYTDMQIVSDFNENMIQTYSTSIATKIRYTHYKFSVPKVKLTGNYLLVVYRNGNVDDVVITRRFVVYNPIVEITPNVQFAVNVQDRDSKQQVDFTVAYGMYDIPNPQDVKVVVRQNFRWDNAITLTQPQYVKFDQKLLDYTFFDGRNTFDAGNEYRFFDIRNLRMKGMNVDAYATSDTTNTVFLVPDRTRNGMTYSDVIDINGKYVVQRSEASDNGVEADYANTYFTLIAPKEYQGDVYLFGQLTDWKLKSRYKMEYDDKSQSYFTNALLKQGFYNYQYCLVSNGKTEGNYFEGDYNLTENFYDIIVYYRPSNQFNDIVIGYKSVDYRGRN